MQVEVVLALELEGHVGGFKKRQVRTIFHTVEGVQRVRTAPGFGFAKFQRADQRQAEKVFIEPARFFRVTAAVGVVVQFADHG